MHERVDINMKYKHEFHQTMNESQKKGVSEFEQMVSNGKLDFENVSNCICGSNNLLPLRSKDRFGIRQPSVICGDCGLIFNSPRLTPESNEYYYTSGLYRKKYGGYNEPSKNISKTAIRMLEFFNGNNIDLTNKTFFEIGANTGYNLYTVMEQGFQASGIEPDNNAISIGRKAGIDIIHGTIENCQLNSKYNVVFMFEVFEHFIDPVQAIKNITNKLNPDYVYISTVGVLAPIWQDIDKFLQVGHPYNYTLGTLTNIMASNGYELINGNESIEAVFRKNANAKIHMNNDYLRIINKFKRHPILKEIRYRFTRIEKILNKIVT